jgi:hypothetical protein
VKIVISKGGCGTRERSRRDCRFGELGDEEDVSSDNAPNADAITGGFSTTGSEQERSGVGT